MATLRIEVISKEIVKPSSPTPDHLHHYQLSFNDQMAPPVYNPLVLFYVSVEGTKFNVVDISNRLKKSLSEVLTLYYPLSGRTKLDNNFIDCNDEGIPYLVARVKCDISDVIQNPVPGELNKLVPFELDALTDISFGVQLNVFDCGGIAVGACISHKIADALSFFVFINTWAATACGDADIVSPQFVAASLFPPKKIPGAFPVGVGITKDNIITNRYVFDASMIESLREKYSVSNDFEDQKPPSRVEALSAFIWSRFVAATKDESGPQKLYAVNHAVNLRPRFDPPQPQSCFGNLFSLAITVPSLKAGEAGPGLVRQVRAQISKVDKDHVKELQGGSQQWDSMRDRAAMFMKGEMVTFSFTSLCRFPLYKADFGWGKPIWVGSPALNFKNLVFFIDTPSGDGIEAYVSLKKEEMAKFEKDEEFLTFVSQTRGIEVKEEY